MKSKSKFIDIYIALFKSWTSKIIKTFGFVFLLLSIAYSVSYYIFKIYTLSNQLIGSALIVLGLYSFTYLFIILVIGSIYSLLLSRKANI